MSRQRWASLGLIMTTKRACRDREDAVRRRWPGAIVTDFSDVEPLAAMTVQDATELASLRRGAEPLRLLPPRGRESRQRSMLGLQRERTAPRRLRDFVVARAGDLTTSRYPIDRHPEPLCQSDREQRKAAT